MHSIADLGLMLVSADVQSWIIGMILEAKALLIGDVYV